MVILCYRRADSSESTDRGREWLEARLPAGQVFMDKFFIEGGEDWRRTVQESLPKRDGNLREKLLISSDISLAP
jgi:hypothetical protein